MERSKLTAKCGTTVLENKVNIKLSNTQLKKLRTAVKEIQEQL